MYTALFLDFLKTEISKKMVKGSRQKTRLMCIIYQVIYLKLLILLIITIETVFI